MKFEVVGLDGKTVMHTKHISCMPSKAEIQSMFKAGYKFKMDGKNITKKKLDDFLAESAGELTDNGGLDD